MVIVKERERAVGGDHMEGRRRLAAIMEEGRSISRQ